MAVTVARGVKTWIREHPDSVFLQVQESSDPDEATRVLEAVAEIAGVGLIGPPAETPTGPVAWYESHGSLKALNSLPDLIVAKLADAGVTDAVVAVPPRSGPVGIGMGTYASAVVLRLYPPPPRTYPHPPWGIPLPSHLRSDLPDWWVTEAFDWVTGGLDDHDQLWARTGGLEFPIAVGDALGFFERGRRRYVSAFLTTGHPREAPRPPDWGRPPWSWSSMQAYSRRALGERVRALHVNGATRFVPSLVVAGGGPGASDDDLVAIAEDFIGLARHLAPELGYALVEIEATFGLFMNDPHGMLAWLRMNEICDEVVFDAFPYQVLGPGHLAKLGGIPPAAEVLEGGRIGLRLGQPADWIIDGPDDVEPSLRRRGGEAMWLAGRQLLEPCLALGGDARRIWRDRLVPQEGDEHPPTEGRQ